MNANNILARPAKCPFYLGKIGKQPFRLQCTGYNNNQAMSFEFWSNQQRAEHYMDYCTNDYNRCPLFKSLYNFKKCVDY